MSFSGITRVSAGINGLQPHQSHEPLNPLSIDLVAFPLHPGRHLATAKERPL